MVEADTKLRRTLLASCVALVLSSGFTLLLLAYFFRNSWFVTRETQLTKAGYFAVRDTFALYGQDLSLSFAGYSLILVLVFCFASYFSEMSLRVGILASLAGCLLAMVQMIGLKTYIMFDSIGFIETSGINAQGISVAIFYVFAMRLLVLSTALSLVAFILLSGLCNLLAKD